MALIPRRNTLDQDFLDSAADLGASRVNDYALFEDYYRGEHKTKLLDRAKKYLQASGLKFAENFCETVIDVFSERLILEGFVVEDKGEAQSESETDDQIGVGDWLDSVLLQNGIDQEQRVVHTNALIKGDAFAIVGWDNARQTPAIIFNRPETIKVSYAEEDYRQLEWAAKNWLTKDAEGRELQRLNLYYPDRVERYFRMASRGAVAGWVRLQDGAEWPTRWVDASGQPLGIPVVHFRHKHLGSAGGYGRSEIRNTIPQQDTLNKQVIDLHDILDYQAWSQRWVTGVPSSSVSYKPEPGGMMHADDPNAKFGQLDPADPSGVLAAIEQTLSRIARRSRTPLHLLVGGDMPSGEALRAAESGLVAKVRASQVVFGSCWEKVAELCLALGNLAGTLPAELQPDQTVSAKWADPQSRNELKDAEFATLLAELGVSRRTLLAERGYDYEQEQEYRALEREAAAEGIGKMLDAGLATDE